jgi:hypothetical protein
MAAYRNDLSVDPMADKEDPDEPKANDQDKQPNQVFG